MTETVLEFKDLFFEWAEGVKLENINLKIKKGSFLLITGHSGSGKSTLLRLASRLETPTKGQILYNNIPVTQIDPEKYRQKVALIQQTPVVLECSVRDNLLLPYSFIVNKDITPPNDDELKKRLTELYLDIPLDKNGMSLSVGQKQRLCILRTLLMNPDILLMDEPTSALDWESKTIVEKISEELNSLGTTIMMISHSEYKPTAPYKRLKVDKGCVIEVAE